MHLFQDFYRSLPYLWHGFKLIQRPRIRRYVIIPVAINIALIVLLLSVFGHYWGHWLSLWTTALPSWLSWLQTLLWLIGMVLAVILFGYTFNFLALIVASPFNGLLSAQVEHYLTGQLPQTGQSFLKDLADDTINSLRIFWYTLWRSLLLGVVTLLLFILPLANTITPVLWFVFGAFSLAFGYMDIPLANRGISFNSRCHYAKYYRGSYLGLGSLITLATAIPIVNFFVMPAAVAAATAMYLDQCKNAQTSTLPSQWP